MTWTWGLTGDVAGGAMNMKKSIFCLFLVFLTLLLCACGTATSSKISTLPQQQTKVPTDSIGDYASLLPKETSLSTPAPTPVQTSIPTPTPTPAPSPNDDKLQGLDLAPITGSFSSADKIQYSLFSGIQDLSRQAGWNVTQNHNPEVSFDEKRQELSIVRFYLTYYGDCTKSEARTAVEEYSETILQYLLAVYPDVEIDTVNICWMIPAIDDQSLYAATFWCDYDGTDLVLGDGQGIIYK